MLRSAYSRSLGGFVSSLINSSPLTPVGADGRRTRFAVGRDPAEHERLIREIADHLRSEERRVGKESKFTERPSRPGRTNTGPDPIYCRQAARSLQRPPKHTSSNRSTSA